ncbi:putative DNA-binding protein [Micromonospora violae]|uniref:Putative DNA-binding protein n=1 Tax=Micromonospora violae TaxID=1278207 RepID=A0A4V2FPC1_9ACTN|nr:ATP-binding protein [Micromonospora violae]RZT80390.1 putative DNA-binding protein [Micromonospora violae]
MPASFDGFRQTFFGKFPEAVQLERALRTARNSNPMFFFHESRDPDLKKSWIVLGRLGPEMEDILSINGEVLFLFSPHEEFQRRSFNKMVDAARQEIADVQRRLFGIVRFTPDSHISLIYSKDPSLPKNLKAWNADGATSLVARVPMLDGTLDGITTDLRKSIATVLASRDLYGGKNPVTGRDFFGRLDTIQSVSAELRNGRSIGLFGLRRSGKTSLLRELQRREEPSGLALVLSDLESTDGVDDIPHQISQDLLTVLRRMREARSNIWLGPEGEHEARTFGELSARLIHVAERNASLNFVIAVDEVENLRRLSQVSPERVRLFLGSLRRAAQATRNLSLFFTGLTTAFFDQSMIVDEVDNPLFGFVDSHFLPPFSMAESTGLVRDLGTSMMLEWDEVSLSAVHSLTGGFPFFVRDLASAVRRAALDELLDDSQISSPIGIRKGHVDAAFGQWKDQAGRNWREIIRTLESYHPYMAEMLRAGTEEEINEWRSIGVDGEISALALQRLGLLIPAEPKGLKRSASLVALDGLAGRPTIFAGDIQKRRDFRSLLSQTESLHLEFKSTARWNLRSAKKDEAMEHAVVKTVAAFLNTDGGTLVIGANDDGRPRGLVEDLSTCRNSFDQYERWLMGSLLGKKIGTDIVSQYVEYAKHTLDGHDLVVLTVRRFPGVAWVVSGEDENLYVRNGNETQQLRGRQVAEFARSRSA